MTHELVAYLIQSDGQIVAMPTNDLLAALDQVRAGSHTQEQRLSSNREAIYAFLQILKSVMQSCKALSAES